jgi:hypothetical protein
MMPVTIFCSVRVAVTIVAGSLSNREFHSMKAVANRGASVLHHEQFYHVGLAKSGISAQFGSRQEW